MFFSVCSHPRSIGTVSMRCRAVPWIERVLFFTPDIRQIFEHEFGRRDALLHMHNFLTKPATCNSLAISQSCCFNQNWGSKRDLWMKQRGRMELGLELRVKFEQRVRVRGRVDKLGIASVVLLGCSSRLKMEQLCGVYHLGLFPFLASCCFMSFIKFYFMICLSQNKIPFTTRRK